MRSWRLAAIKPAMLFRLLLMIALFYVVMRLLGQAMPQSRPQSQPRRPPQQPPRKPPGRSPYEVLGVTPGTPPEEIHAAYQRLMREYHPDRVANLAQEFRDLAEQRSKEINAAYEQLKRG